MKRSGLKLKIIFRSAGYDVKNIQEYLYLSCPQPIYRWFKGKTLPSVEHLCALSRLFRIHAEEMLVFRNQPMFEEIRKVTKDNKSRRMLTYYEYIHKAT